MPAKKPTKNSGTTKAAPKSTPAKAATLVKVAPAVRLKALPGCKVLIRARAGAGFAHFVGLDGDKARLRFFTDAVNYVEVAIPAADLAHPPLPNQSRVFHQKDGVTRYGRIMAPKEMTSSVRTYQVHFPGAASLTEMREDEFMVRSYLPGDDATAVLAEMSQETPFFFQQRADLLRELLQQNRLAHGLPALLSSKVEILQHQAEIADRVLRDPTIRYLLADEVGLGKTIEAAIILRQIRLDAPEARMAIVAPDALTRQWREELDSRFGLDDVEIFSHADLVRDEELRETEWDMLVMDEAHRLVARHGQEPTAQSKAARKLAHAARHVLLLSATPVLHHDEDLLALLEMLDPENFSSSRLQAFKERTARRVELGRAFLALRSATVPALVKLHAGKLAGLLPEDRTVKQFAADLAKPGADSKTIQHELHLHISETYRIHRRMLRTRRRWLAGQQKRFIRDVQETVEIALDEEPHLKLWQALEKWRVAANKRLGVDASAAAAYIRLAETIASDPEKLGEVIKDVCKETRATADEEKCLKALIDDQVSWAMAEARLDLIAESLRRRAMKDGSHSKYVIFCPSPRISADLGKRLHPLFSSTGVRIATVTTVGSEAGEVFAEFAADSQARVLITDATGEEGFNLQFAKAVFFHDLPWSPMRLEQRLGRLDRIDRIGSIPCVVFTTSEDDSLALDEAWRRVLAEGFGLYRASISDLQHLVDSELPRLQAAAFAGGPAALIEVLPALAEAVQKERASIEEQDVIDGMHSLAPESELTRDITAADASAETFGTAFSAYLQRNLGLEERWDEETNALFFRMKRDSNPLIPADKLDSLAAMFAAKFTVHRTVCIEDLSLDFLRPGHPAVDGCRELLAWDDRGRAWALWRSVPGCKTPKLVFRTHVRCTVDLRVVEEAIAQTGWDCVRRGGLLRLVRGWFPEMLTELWFDEVGNDPAAKLIEPCKRPYHFKIDRNMGKERAQFLRDQFGAEAWAKACRTAAKRALAAVRKSEDFIKATEQARKQAAAHFSLIRARLKAREQAGIDSAVQARAEAKQQDAIEQLVADILANPVVTLDTIGAYVLSEKPWWNEPDWDPDLAARYAKGGK